MSGFLVRVVERSLGVAPVVHRRREPMYGMAQAGRRNFAYMPMDVPAEDASREQTAQALDPDINRRAGTRGQDTDGQAALPQIDSPLQSDGGPFETAQSDVAEAGIGHNFDSRSNVENRDDARYPLRHSLLPEPRFGGESDRAGFAFAEAARARPAVGDPTFRPHFENQIPAELSDNNSSGSYMGRTALSRSSSDEGLLGGRDVGERAGMLNADTSASKSVGASPSPTLRSVATWLTRESGAPAPAARDTRRLTESARAQDRQSVPDAAVEEPRNERTGAAPRDALDADAFDALAPREQAARAVLRARRTGAESALETRVAASLRAQRMDDASPDDKLTINVSIASIEIARPAPVVAAAQHVHPSAPRPSLGDYLKLRQKVRGR